MGAGNRFRTDVDRPPNVLEGKNFSECLLTNPAAQGKIEGTDVESLLKQCEERRLWGSVKFFYQDGRVVYAEVTQTLKGHPVDPTILVVLSQR